MIHLVAMGYDSHFRFSRGWTVLFLLGAVYTENTLNTENDGIEIPRLKITQHPAGGAVPVGKCWLNL